MLFSWTTNVALGDSLTAGRGDEGRDGHPVGWAQRLADVLSVRTAVRCGLVNLAVDGATVGQVLAKQLPAVAACRPDLVSVTVGMNDIRVRGFDELSFKADLGQLLESLAATQATLLTCTLPDITAIMALSPDLADVARDRLRLISDIIREQAEHRQGGQQPLRLTEALIRRRRHQGKNEEQEIETGADSGDDSGNTAPVQPP